MDTYKPAFAKPSYKRIKTKVHKIQMQEHRECWATKQTEGLHMHHIFYGTGKRALSEKYGLTVWLRPDWHNMSNYGVHFDHVFDLQLKREAQKRFEQEYGHKEWMKIFGRSYL